VTGSSAGRFVRVEPRRAAAGFVTGLLADLTIKTCWQLAEQAGHARPDAMQSLLYRAKRDADAVRDDVRKVVADRLGDPDGVLVVDETGDLKKGMHTVEKVLTGADVQPLASPLMLDGQASAPARWPTRPTMTVRPSWHPLLTGFADASFRRTGRLVRRPPRFGRGHAYLSAWRRRIQRRRTARVPRTTGGTMKPWASPSIQLLPGTPSHCPTV
jgi:hypothetical protein